MGSFNLKTRLNNVPTVDESYNALFGSNVGGSVVKLKLADLKPYPNQPFAPYTAEKLEQLAQDIAENGVLSPIIARKMPADENNPYTYYQILSGHNRVEACRLIGLEEVPALVKEVDDLTAQLIMVNTNLNQRDTLLPSEKAFAYKMQMDSMKQQSGKRTDLVSIGDKVNSAYELSEKLTESRANIFRYIRLTFLIPPLLNLVDNEALPFRAGVELSYLSVAEQEILSTYISENNIKISLAQAEDLKRYSKEMEHIDQKVLDRIFKVERVKNPPTAVKIKYKTLKEYIPQSVSNEAVEGYILEALKFYKNNGGDMNE